MVTHLIILNKITTNNKYTLIGKSLYGGNKNNVF
jgi:hypothetical protein